MFNNPDPTIFAPDESVENAEPQRVFLLRVDVIETATGKSADNGTLGKLLQRRLKRIERTFCRRQNLDVEALEQGAWPESVRTKRMGDRLKIQVRGFGA